MAKKRIIIGIHGLRNKPAEPILREWWRQSIIEGFQVLSKPVANFQWNMAYWVHIFISGRQQHLFKVD